MASEFTLGSLQSGLSDFNSRLSDLTSMVDTISSSMGGSTGSRRSVGSRSGNSQMVYNASQMLTMDSLQKLNEDREIQQKRAQMTGSIANKKGRSKEEDGVEFKGEQIPVYNTYPVMSNEVMAEIGDKARKWRKVDESVAKIRALSRQLSKEKGQLEESLIKDIQMYGLNDIIHGDRVIEPFQKPESYSGFKEDKMEVAIAQYLERNGIDVDVGKVSKEMMSDLKETRKKKNGKVVLKMKKREDVEV